MTATIVYPTDVPTSLTENEGRALADLATGKVVLELGAWQGASTILMGQTASVLHSVDWHRGDQHAGHGRTLTAYLQNLQRYGLLDKVITHIGSFEDVVPALQADYFDLVFLDGFHTYEQVVVDLSLAYEVVEGGGMLAVHDFTLDGMQVDGVEFGVKRAFDEWGRGDVVDVIDSLAIIEV